MGAGAERRTRDDGDVRFLEHGVGDRRVGRQGASGGGASADQGGHRREQVEGALGRLAAQSVGACELGLREVATGGVTGSHHPDRILRAVEGGDRGGLTDRRGARRDVALDGGHGVDQIGGAGRPADPPAGHGVGFRDAADGQRPVA